MQDKCKYVIGSMTTIVSVYSGMSDKFDTEKYCAGSIHKIVDVYKDRECGYVAVLEGLPDISWEQRSTKLNYKEVLIQSCWMGLDWNEEYRLKRRE